MTQRFVYNNGMYPRYMDMDTSYGEIMNSDKNIEEFVRALGILLRPLQVTFYDNEARCLWASAVYSTYPLTLVVDEPQVHLEGTCPKCHDEGKWVRTALVCNEHGVFGGF